MDELLNEAAALRDKMAATSLTDDQRKQILDVLLEQFCPYCGDNRGWACQCRNDE